jgi:hypothetical protein
MLFDNTADAVDLELARLKDDNEMLRLCVDKLGDQVERLTEALETACRYHHARVCGQLGCSEHCIVLTAALNPKTGSGETP